jgi:hypothetical protein
MTTEPCRMGEAWVKTLGLICNDDRTRRTWLWLRARQKDDHESIECLERGEPGLRARMAEYDERARRFDDPGAQSEAYAKMLGELTLSVSKIVCGCPRCAS